MDNINTWINNLIALVGNLETLIGVIVGFAIAIIAAYKKVMAAWNEKKLLEVVAPLIGQTETEPIKLYKELVNKPLLLSRDATENKDRENIVVQALQEREPKLLKKMKLKDAFQIGNWVTQAYQIVKPIIKSLKK